jgi:hypothetical protein
MTGRAKLMIYSQFAGDAMRPWASSAFVDKSTFTAGWNATTYQLALVANKWGQLGDADEGARWVADDYIIVVDRNPVDPNSLQAWESYGPYKVAKNYEVDGANLLTLQSGTTLTNFCTNTEYVVISANYSDASAAQKANEAYQGGVVTQRFGASGKPHRWG